MDNNNERIKTTTPLPCGVVIADGECGRDAYLLAAKRAVGEKDISPTGYKWAAMPICDKCIWEMRELYLPDDLITITEAASLLGIRTQTVRGHIDRGNLAAYKDFSETNQKKSTRVSREEVDGLRQILDKQRAQSHSEKN